jgi:hypothetical protein
MKRTWIITAGAVIAMFMAGCEKSSTGLENLGDAVTIAEEEVADLKAAEATNSDIAAARFGGHLLAKGMMIGGDHLFFGAHFPRCATVTVDSDEFPKTITIDYTDGCSDRMGMEKTGIITIYMTDTIINAGAEYTVTFDNLSFGNRTISKTATITNEGTNDDGNWVISFESLSTTTFERDGEPYEIVRDFSGEREWQTGFLTPEVGDDILFVSGGGTITVNGEITFTKTITEPLLIDRSCRYPLSGIVEITRDGETMTIDYGDGECDNIAEVTKDGVTEQIELNSCRFRDGFERQHKYWKQHKGWW